MACIGKNGLILCCSWMLKIGASPVPLNEQLTASGPLQERPGQLVVLSSTVALHHHPWACYRLSSLCSHSGSHGREELVLPAKVQGSKVKLMGLGESVSPNKSRMCLSAHRE